MSRLTGDVAPAGTTCGACDLDVGGWLVGVTADGTPTWDRPAHKAEKPDGTRYWTGGFTHVEGGERCGLSFVLAPEDPTPPTDRVVVVGAARAKLAMAGATT